MTSVVATRAGGDRSLVGDGADPSGSRHDGANTPIAGTAILFLLAGLALFDRPFGLLGVPGVPVYVTENGMADDVEPDASGTVNDAARVSYLNRYLGAVLEARAAGADVRGYLVWSMLDNFEWAMGYGPRFGIVHVDYQTLKRTPKASYHFLAELAGARAAT